MGGTVGNAARGAQQVQCSTVKQAGTVENEQAARSVVDARRERIEEVARRRGAFWMTNPAQFDDAHEGGTKSVRAQMLQAMQAENDSDDDTSVANNTNEMRPKVLAQERQWSHQPSEDDAMSCVKSSPAPLSAKERLMKLILAKKTSSSSKQAGCEDVHIQDQRAPQEQISNEQDVIRISAKSRLQELLERRRSNQVLQGNTCGTEEHKVLIQNDGAKMNENMCISNALEDSVSSSHSDDENKRIGEDDDHEHSQMATHSYVKYPHGDSTSVLRPLVPSASEDEDDDDEDDSDKEDNGQDAFVSLLTGIQRQMGASRAPPKANDPAQINDTPQPKAKQDDSERAAAARRTLELMEARRLADLARESGHGRKKNKRCIDKRCSKDAVRQKMDEDMEAEERGQRYLNNKVVLAKRGDKLDDATKQRRAQECLGSEDIGRGSNS